MYDSPATSHVLYRNQRRDFPVIDRAEGVYLYDQAGKRYLDGVGGAAVVTIGHNVAEILEAIQRQWQHVCFAYGGMFTSEAHIGLANRVAELAPEELTKVFFVSGGSEATESALKLARQYFVETGRSSKYKMVSRWGSYHGNTIGALSMSARPSWKELYGPLLIDFRHIEPAYPYRCVYCRNAGSCTLRCADELERVILDEGADTIAGFIADPVVGSTLAASAAPPGYFQAIREICDRHDVLLILDEVITGFGRTGTNFGIDHWGVTPDLIACGKGMSSGYVPLGAVVVRDRFADAFAHGSGTITHGFTYGGNPLSCSIALAVQDYVREHALIQRSAELGTYLHERASRLYELRSVGDVRGGKGLFLGVELVEDRDARRPYPRELKVGERVLAAALEQGLTLYPGTGGPHGDGGDSLMLAPPFVITREQIDELLGLLASVIASVETQVEGERRGELRATAG